MIVTSPFPDYERRVASFEERFGVPAEHVVHAMNAAGDDVVEQPPRFPIGLTHVGYRQADAILSLDDPFESGRRVSAVASVRIDTAVPATRRGVHMSRLGDVLATSLLDGYPDLPTYAAQLASAVDRCQYGGPTAIDVRASVPYLERVPAERGGVAKTSLEHLHLVARVRSSPDAATPAEIGAGLRVHHIVACPCVQRMMHHAQRVTTREDAAIEPAEAAIAPQITHTQRCETTIVCYGATGRLRIPALLERLDQVVCRTQNTLPRGSELSLVFRAHRSPQFIEDALRDALWSLWKALDRPFTRLTGHARSLESIHAFDLTASTTIRAEDLRALFR